MNVVVSPTHNRSEFTADSNCSFSVERGSAPGTVLLWVRSPTRVASFLGPTMEISVQPRSTTTGGAAAVATAKVNLASVKSMSIGASSLAPSTPFDEELPSYANVVVDGDTCPTTSTPSYSGPYVSPSDGGVVHPSSQGFETTDLPQGRSMFSIIASALNRDRADERVFEVYVATLDGEKYTVEVHSSMTVGRFKEKYQAVSGQAPDATRLIYAGRQLEDSKTMADYGVQKGTILHAVLRLRGS